ncbi:MAG: putative Ig domain-containing protein, partial [Gemmatimonadota bacterium]|nr:putative Ig domain-containing protein [Gemmatimonadota bacterium]
QSTSVTFDLNNLVEIVGIEFNIKFDPSLVQLTEAKPVGGASGLVAVGLDISKANSSGELSVSMLDITLSNPIPVGLGNIFQLGLSFQGTGKARFTISKLALSDAGSNTVPAEVYYSDMALVAVNHAPAWDTRIDTLRLKEGQAFSSTFLIPTDEDGDEVKVAAVGLPRGAGFDTGSLAFSWTPGLDSYKLYQFLLVARDAKGARSSKKVILLVEQANRAPAFILPSALVQGKQGASLDFTLDARDPDGDPVKITAENLPEGAKFLGSVLRWPEPVPGEYTITFVVTDQEGLSLRKQVTFTIQGVNHPPEFKAMPDIQATVGVAVELKVEAVDVDVGEQLTYSLLAKGVTSALAPATGIGTVIGDAAKTGLRTILDRGGSFTGNTFNWTPTDRDIGPNILTFLVKDSQGAADRMEVTIQVAGRGIKAPPQLAELKEITVTEGQEIDFTIPITYSDLSKVKFWGANLPEGAQFDSGTGRFTWVPGLLQAGRYKVTFGASDGRFQCVGKLAITVQDKDEPPVLKAIGKLSVPAGGIIRHHLKARDPGGDPVSFSAENLPEGAKLHSGGLFSFKPGYQQAGQYEVTFHVQDLTGNSVSETVTLTVNETNRRPLLEVKNIKTPLGVSVSLDVAVSDPDGDTVSVVPDPSTLPQGALFDPSSLSLSWTPGEDGIYEILLIASDGKAGGTDSIWAVITVGEANLPPEIDEIADQVLGEGDTLELEFDVFDPDSSGTIAVQARGMPSGASLSVGSGNPATVQLRLAPGYLDQGEYEVRVKATDGHAAKPLSVVRRFKLEVGDTEVQPAFTRTMAGEGDLNLTVAENGTLELDLTASDPGGDELGFSLAGLPLNAYVDYDSETPKVIFNPAYDQAGTHEFTVSVSDGTRTVSRKVVVTVADLNRPPKVFKIDGQSVAEGDIITFEVGASDPDGDTVTVFTAGRVPFLTAGDDPPASIRDGKVFIFDTALLPTDRQIESAVFLFWGQDERGKVSDTIRVEIAVERSDSLVSDEVSSGSQYDFNIPGGFGLKARLQNNSGNALRLLVKILEKSGFLEHAGLPMLASEGRQDKRKVQTGVFPFLAGDELESQFYGIRRGWGLDLSAQSPVEGADMVVTLGYFEEDLPTEIPNFTEGRLSVFGYDANLETWVKVEGVTVDTVANEATITVTDYSIVEYTIGAVLDVVAPVITGMEVVAGNSTVVSTVVDTTYNLEGPFEFRVNITDDEIVSSTGATFYYSIDGGEYTLVELVRSSGNLFTAQVQGPLTEGARISYYIEAQDNMNVTYSPQGAPDNVYEMVFLELTALPGDVDGSGAVDVFDLLDLLKVLSGAQEPSTSSDVDHNSKTDIFDLLDLLGILAK